jgi:hypothetical protein
MLEQPGLVDIAVAGSSPAFLAEVVARRIDE